MLVMIWIPTPLHNERAQFLEQLGLLLSDASNGLLYTLWLRHNRFNPLKDKIEA